MVLSIKDSQMTLKKMESLNKGDKVIIQLNTKEIFEGNLDYYCDNYISLENGAYSELLKAPIDIPLTFYKDEMLSIRKIPVEAHVEENEQQQIIDETFVEKNRKIMRGDRIKILLQTGEILIGTVVSCQEDKIEIRECLNESNSEIDYMSIFRNETKSIKILCKTTTTNKSTVNGTVADNILINLLEFNRLKDLTMNYIVIKVKDIKFDNAYDDLLSSETIGVHALGSNFNLIQNLSILIMCTFQKIYIFDILALGFRNELRQLLEHNEIMKVLHNAKPFVYYLHFKHKCKISNLFDTQVADDFIQKNDLNKQSERNLSQCLAAYLNFPPEMLSSAMEEAKGSWQERPLPSKASGQLIRASRLVVYLIPLKDFLLKLMLKDYYLILEKTMDIKNLELIANNEKVQRFS